MKTYLLAGVAGALVVAVIAQSQVSRAPATYELASVTSGIAVLEGEKEVSRATICYFGQDGCRAEETQISRVPGPTPFQSNPSNAAMAAAAKLEAEGWELRSTAGDGGVLVLFFQRPARS